MPALRLIFKGGERFGRWTVNHNGASICNGKVRTVNCTCECGTKKDVVLLTLINGASKGCLQCGNSKHNMTETPTWNSWYAMRFRCERKNATAYPDYGGRGIKICAEWSEFAVFFADMGERPDGMSIERIDVNGDYTKENCRWATAIEQCNNRRYQRWVIYQGVEYTVAELARYLGVGYKWLWKRVNKGIDMDSLKLAVATQEGAQ